mgnify:CR=1 FL=1
MEAKVLGQLQIESRKNRPAANFLLPSLPSLLFAIFPSFSVRFDSKVIFFQIRMEFLAF